MKETIKCSEKINMILFGRKKFVSEFLKATPQLWMSHVRFPSLPKPSSAASREGGKVFGLNAVGRSMADKLTLGKSRSDRVQEGRTRGPEGP